MLRTPESILSITQPPSEHAVRAEADFARHITSHGLQGYRDVLGAHAASWYKTANALITPLANNVSLAMSGTSGDYMISDVQKTVHAIPQGSCMQALASFCVNARPGNGLSTEVGGVNCWSIKKQEVGQLFRLTAYLSPEDRPAALRAIAEVAPLVSQVMTELNGIERELSIYAQESTTIAPIDRSKISNAANYHFKVSQDWSNFGAPAEKSLELPMAPQACTATQATNPRGPANRSSPAHP